MTTIADLHLLTMTVPRGRETSATNETMPSLPTQTAQVAAETVDHGSTRQGEAPRSKKSNPPSRRSRRWQQYTRNQLPYGQWTAADGRVVLFNRYYQPILQRRPGQAATLADPNEWVSFEKEEWFYDDSCPPHRNRKTYLRVEAILASWA